MPTIERIEFQTFTYELDGLSVDESANTVFTPGSKVKRTGWAVTVRDSDGVSGSFVQAQVRPGDAGARPAARQLSSATVRRSSKQDVRRGPSASCASWAFGYSALDITLVGSSRQALGVPVSRELGGFQQALADLCQHLPRRPQRRALHRGGLRRLRRRLRGHGFRAFKIHGWTDGDSREEAANVATSRPVGDRHGPDARSRPAS